MNFAQRVANLLIAYRFLPGPVAAIVKELAVEVDTLRARVDALEKRSCKCKFAHLSKSKRWAMNSKARPVLFKPLTTKTPPSNAR